MGLGARTKQEDLTVTGGGHLLALYDTEEYLVESVGDFLAPALWSGAAALVVATADHRARFEAALRASGVDADEARTAGRLVVLDAAETLDRFMVDGGPDSRRFHESVGVLVADLNGRFGSVRIYGEMVALLWDHGDVAGAIALEDLWNDLAAEIDFDLLCAYPKTSFDSEDATEPFRRVCDRHTELVPSERIAAAGADDDRRRAVAMLEQQLGAISAERAALEEQRRELESALTTMREHDRVRNEFVAMVVHDIRTPASVVSSFLSLLRDNWSTFDRDQIDDFLGRAMDNVTRVERLVDDILTVARLESRQFAFAVAPTDMADIVSRTVASVAATAEVPIALHIDDPLPLARADAARQTQILDNLLTNAVKFSPLDTPVSVRLKRMGEHLVVAVTDHGPGIPAEEAHLLFKPFSRLSRPGRQAAKGTGLGLYISKCLAESQGGSISMSSHPSTGTTFSVTIPVWTASEA